MSRRRSQRTASRPQLPATRPTRIEKPSSRHTSPNSLILRRKAGSATLFQEQEAQYYQAISRPIGRADLARLGRPLSWHSSTASELPRPTYNQPLMVQTTPSGIGRSSYDWPEDGNGLTLPSLQPTSTYLHSANPQTAIPTTHYNIAQPMWASSGFGNAATYPLVQVDFPHQPYTATQYSQDMQMAMHSSATRGPWQHNEVPGLEDDASPCAEDPPVNSADEELVGLGLYDDTVRTSTHLMGLGVKNLKLTEGWTPPLEQLQKSSTQSKSYVQHENLSREAQKQSTTPASQAYPYDLFDHSFLFNKDDYGREWYEAQQMADSNDGHILPRYA